MCIRDSVKGDVTGIAQPGDDTENIAKRVEKFGIEDWQLEGCPTRLWDMLDDQGIPVRITISDMGPIMLKPSPIPRLINRMTPKSTTPLRRFPHFATTN